MVASGFALAVQPVTAETVIKTDAAGLVSGPVEIPAKDINIPAYRAMPAGAGPFPIVIVVQEIFGVHEWIQDICRRLAHLGYLAVAPALYARQGDPAKEASIPDILKNIVAYVPDEQVLSDLDATAKWAAQNGGDGKRLGMTGFCWGGRITWLYAARNPKLRAAVAWYGQLVGTPNAMIETFPVDNAANLLAPVLGLYGGQDTGISLESVEKMREALKSAKARSEIIVYPDAGHGFLADYRPSYNPEAAADAWKRLLAWFKEHGVY
ncbi:MAG: dienelactone hydrolase family protein [Betaproteobacteria bacterium]|nr:dienelactone hydrolase family protein [Betaproteobacteria bacterium]